MTKQPLPARLSGAPPPPVRAAPPPVQPSARQVSVGDRTWTVRVIGSGNAGSSPSGRVPLLQVVLESADAPPVTGLVAGRRLDDVQEDVLAALVRSAREPSATTPRSCRAVRSRHRG